MLASTLAALVGASLALASATLGPDGSLAVSSSQSEKEALSHITYKEICYRNLYADTEDFTIRHTTEALISDTSGQTVFLSDGRKKDYEDKEWWYEEFCYKKFKGRERNKEAQSSSGILVSREAPLDGAALDGSFARGADGVPGSPADEVLADRDGGGSSSSSSLSAFSLAGDITSDGPAPMILRSRKRHPSPSPSPLDPDEPEALGQGSPLVCAAGEQLASVGGNDTGRARAPAASGFAPAAAEGEGEILAQPLRPASSSAATAAPARQQAHQQQQKQLEARSPGWIVRVLRIVSVSWDGHDDDDDEAGGTEEQEECEVCEECGGEEEGEDEGLDDGPQGGLFFDGEDK